MLAIIALIFTNLFSLSAQTVASTAPGINIKATSYKYLKTVNGKDEPQPVPALAQAPNGYDIRTAAYYEDDYENYFICFNIPNGETLAAYDKNGKLIRTAEKYEFELLPSSIATSVAKKYPNWTISKEVYLVTYFDENARETDSRYKLILEKGTQRIKIKTNSDGEIF